MLIFPVAVGSFWVSFSAEVQIEDRKWLLSLSCCTRKNESRSTVTTASCCIWMISSVATIMPPHFLDFFLSASQKQKDFIVSGGNDWNDFSAVQWIKISLSSSSFKLAGCSWLSVTLASAPNSLTPRWRCGPSWPLPSTCPMTCAPSAPRPAPSCRTSWPSPSTRIRWASRGDASWRWRLLLLLWLCSVAASSDHSCDSHTPSSWSPHSSRRRTASRCSGELCPAAPALWFSLAAVPTCRTATWLPWASSTTPAAATRLSPALSSGRILQSHKPVSLDCAVLF